MISPSDKAQCTEILIALAHCRGKISSRVDTSLHSLCAKLTTRKKLVPVCWTFILSKYKSKSFNTQSCYSLDEC